MSESPEPRERRAERDERNRRILRDRRAGVPWRLIAAKYGISERQARRARDEALVAADVGEVDPERLVLRMLRANVKALDRMEARLDNATSENAEIGAARTVAQVSGGLMDLLMRAGLLPAAGLAAVWHADSAAEVLVEAFEHLAADHGVSPDEVARVLERAASTTAVAVFDGVAA